MKLLLRFVAQMKRLCMEHTLPFPSMPIVTKIEGERVQCEICNPNALLASGKHGNTFKCKNLLDGQWVIVKQLPRNDSAIQRASIVSEEKLALLHPYLPGHVETVYSQHYIYLVKPYYEGIDLKQFMLNHSGRKWQAFYLRLIIKVAQALMALHEQGYYHGDIKPSNILIKCKDVHGLAPDAAVDAVLLDVGSARAFYSQGRWPFSAAYAAPEQLLGFGSLTHGAADCYSLGVLLFECITGEKMYQDANPEFMFNRIVAEPVNMEAIPDLDMRKLLAKACAKKPLRKPPRAYPKAELRQLLQEGILNRFQTPKELSEELQKILEKWKLQG
jgi:serine/threonine protein kinase